MGKILLQTCGQIITRECQKIYFREEGRFLWCLFKGPRLHTTTIPFESTQGELWAVWKSRLTHGHRGAPSRILDRMPSNPCCLAASQEFVLHGTTWEEALGAQEEGKQQRHPLFQRPSFRVWVQSAGAWGALCLHSAEVSGWVFGFGGFDVQRTSLL